MRPLRWVLVATALLAGCKGDKGDMGTAGTAGTPGTNGSSGATGGTGATGAQGPDFLISDRAKHGLEISTFPITTTGLTSDQLEQIGQGSYLVNAVMGCGDCHTNDPTKPYAGGVTFPIDASGHFVTSRNITSDPTTGMKLTEAEFVTMFQTGVDSANANQILYVMPWPYFRWMNTDDIKAVYAYIKQIPAVSNAIPADSKGNAGLVPPIPLPDTYNEGAVDPDRPPLLAEVDVTGSPVPDPDRVLRGLSILPVLQPAGFNQLPADTQAQFGRGSYLVNAAQCSDCHTNQGGLPRIYVPGPTFLNIPTDVYLTGGAIFGVPPPLQAMLHQTRTMSANLLGHDHGFFNEPDNSFGVFDGVIEEEAHIDDNPPLPLGYPMPASHFRQMEVDDLTAVYTYMRLLATTEGETGTADKATQDYARYCAGVADCFDGETCNMNANTGNECVGGACGDDSDCDACQHCTNHVCTAPDATADAACLNTGM